MTGRFLTTPVTISLRSARSSSRCSFSCSRWRTLFRDCRFSRISSSIRAARPLRFSAWRGLLPPEGPALTLDGARSPGFPGATSLRGGALRSNGLPRPASSPWGLGRSSGALGFGRSEPNPLLGLNGLRSPLRSPSALAPPCRPCHFGRSSPPAVRGGPVRSKGLRRSESLGRRGGRSPCTPRFGWSCPTPSFDLKGLRSKDRACSAPSVRRGGRSSGRPVLGRSCPDLSRGLKGLYSPLDSP